MRILILMLSASLVLAGCTSSTTSTGTTPPTMSPIQAGVCDVETDLAQDFGSVIASQCSSSQAVACGNALLAALGNANLCANSTVAAATAAQIKAAKAQMKAGVKPQGVIANIVCPIAIPAVMGLLTGIIPTACACAQNIAGSTISSGLTSVCELLPI